MAQRDTSTLQSLDRALAVLDRLLTQDSVSLAQLSEEMGLSTSTVRRILSSLEDSGYLEKDNKAKVYRVGVKMLRLGNIYSRRYQVQDIARPIMAHLRDRCNETVHLCVLANEKRINLCMEQGNQPIIHLPPLGIPQPILQGASSKVLLAFAPKVTANSILKKLPERMDTPPYEKSLFLETIEQVRRQRYATSNSEQRSGIAAISVPIFDQKDQLAAALAIGTPVQRYSIEKQMELLELLRFGAKEIHQQYLQSFGV